MKRDLVLPTLVMLKNVQSIMNTSFLFCTATLPAFNKRNNFDGIDKAKSNNSEKMKSITNLNVQ